MHRVVLAVLLLCCAGCCDGYGLFPPRRTANHVASATPPTYPGLETTNNLTQYTIGHILANPHLVGNTHNISYVFNVTDTHLSHMPWLGSEMNSTTGSGYTLWLPDDIALMEGKSRWETFLKEKYNLTSVDISKTWNMTETNQTLEKEFMNWTHAGISWSISQGNWSLYNLSSENLLPTMLFSNNSQFAVLGNNDPQKMRIIKGDNITVYGTPIKEKFPEMTHTNRTDVMVVSGSGQHLYQIGHVYREILAKNGRIYILDRAVDFPFNTTDVLKSENATLFLKGISKSGFNDTINNTPNMTILVPTDSAIYQTMKDYAISNATHQKWTQEQMKAILTPYIINGTFYGKDLNTTSTLHSIGGHTLNITHTPTNTLINQNVSVIQTDILTRNGVVHILNDTFRTLEKSIIDTLPK